MQKCFLLVGLSSLFFSLNAMSIDAKENERFLTLYSLHCEELNPSKVAAINISKAMLSSVTPTPSQPEGPFYRRTQENDVDLTVKNNGDKALGVEINVKGRVMDLQGNFIKDAQVEIWQACASGSYDHPADGNTAPRDPNFQYYGCDKTDLNGEYGFRTIIPGAYATGDDWVRPPHIHFIITAENHNKVTTQLYFDGASFGNEPVSELEGKKINGITINELNEKDYLLTRLALEQQKRLIVPFNKINNSYVGGFDIYLDPQ